MAPELVYEFTRAFQEEVNQNAAERERQFKADRRQLETIERKIAGIVAVVEDGNYSRALSDRLSDPNTSRRRFGLDRARPLHPLSASIRV